MSNLFLTILNDVEQEQLYSQPTMGPTERDLFFNFSKPLVWHTSGFQNSVPSLGSLNTLLALE